MSEEGRDDTLSARQEPSSGVEGEGPLIADPYARHVPSVAEKLVAALDRLARAQRQQRQAAASRLGITPLQGELLKTLGEGPPPTALVGLLARELAVSQPTVTDSLTTLERKGLITRSRSAQDQRRTRLELTDAGREMVEALAEAEADVVKAVSSLATEQQEAAYAHLLTLIERFVRADLIDVARTCLTCKYMAASANGDRHCRLLNVPLPDAALRVNCPEHEQAA